jgi:ribosome recycling factor
MSDLKQRMEGAINALKNEFSGLRTGRASTELLSPVKVEAYGQEMPLNQVGSVNVVDARTLSVSVWDKGMVTSVEKAIRESGLGLNPAVDGQVVRIPLPELNEERRLDLVKVARKYAEEGRVAIRNVRRDGMDTIKKQQKDSEISEDDAKYEEQDIQKLTDEYVGKVDALLADKEKDIQSV